MFRRSSLTWPILLTVVLLALIVILLVIWIIAQAATQQWALLTVGTIFFALILIGMVMYTIITIKEIRLNQRQTNFIDSVTHELKSPIASIKLYLQTLDMRDVDPDQQRQFHRFMLEDVQRLDSLIDHLLVAARIGAESPLQSAELIRIDETLRRCADVVRRRYNLTDAQITLDIDPLWTRGKSQDVEMLFANLLDNAVKYGAETPEVRVEAKPYRKGSLRVRVSDNGQGVGLDLRRKIFNRFFRGGSELERTTKGTGLGLFIVRTIVSRMNGSVNVHGRGPLGGATFDVVLPQVAPPEATNPAPSSPAAAVVGEPTPPGLSPTDATAK